MRQALVTCILWASIGLPQLLPATQTQQQQQTLQDREVEALGATISRDDSGRVNFLPLKAFEILAKMKASERRSFLISDREFDQYLNTLKRHQDFHSRNTARASESACLELIESHPEYQLVMDHEMAASSPSVTLADLIERAEIAFVAHIESAEVGFRGTSIGTLVELRVLESLKSDALAPDVGLRTDYFIHSYDTWVGGLRLCSGWNGHYREAAGDDVLILAGPTPTAGRFSFSNVFLVVDDQVQPEPLPFLRDLALNLEEVRP